MPLAALVTPQILSANPDPASHQIRVGSTSPQPRSPTPARSVAAQRYLIVARTRSIDDLKQAGRDGSGSLHSMDAILVYTRRVDIPATPCRPLRQFSPASLGSGPGLQRGIQPSSHDRSSAYHLSISHLGNTKQSANTISSRLPPHRAGRARRSSPTPICIPNSKDEVDELLCKCQPPKPGTETRQPCQAAASCTTVTPKYNLMSVPSRSGWSETQLHLTAWLHAARRCKVQT